MGAFALLSFIFGLFGKTNRSDSVLGWEKQGWDGSTLVFGEDDRLLFSQDRWANYMSSVVLTVR